MVDSASKAGSSKSPVFQAEASAGRVSPLTNLSGVEAQTSGTATGDRSSGSTRSQSEAPKSPPVNEHGKGADDDAVEENDEQSRKNEADSSLKVAEAGADHEASVIPSSAPASTWSNAPQHGWQAVWSAPHNAYYFWNAETNTTTWTNPLAESSTTPATATATASATASASASAAYADPVHTRQPPNVDAEANETVPAGPTDLDPDLAFLDPGLYASSAGRQSGGQGAAYTARGTFDRRTGRFVPSDAATAYDPSRHSQTAKAKRQMEAYFDVDQWEKAKDDEFAQRGEKDGGDRKNRHSKHPTKKELELYKERKKEKREAKYGWLKS